MTAKNLLSAQKAKNEDKSGVFGGTSRCSEHHSKIEACSHPTYECACRPRIAGAGDKIVEETETEDQHAEISLYLLMG